MTVYSWLCRLNVIDYDMKKAEICLSEMEKLKKNTYRKALPCRESVMGVLNFIASGYIAIVQAPPDRDYRAGEVCVKNTNN